MAARGARCLLVCAEESAAQVRLRADRLGTLAPELFVVSETSLPAIVALRRRRVEPVVLAIDSIQAVHDPDAPGAAGFGHAGARRRAALVRLAKERDIATVLVGHVTKDGALAGPRALEHVVDTVLSFEGDRHHALRMLRALKHRFGATDELGLMEMTGDGLAAGRRSERAVPRRPARRRVRLGGRRGDRRHASAVRRGAGARRAARPARRSPRRVAQAFDGNRLVDARRGAATARAASRSPSQDVYASVAGGVRVAEPGADLAVALAIAGRAQRHARSTPTRSSSARSASAARSARCRRRRAGSPRRCGSGSAARSCPLSTPDVPRHDAATGSPISREALLAASRAPARGSLGSGSDREDLLAQRRSEVLYAALRLVAPGHPVAGGHRPHPAGEDGRAHRRRRRSRRC